MSKSPVPTKNVDEPNVIFDELEFIIALDQVVTNKQRITRLAWQNKEYYVCMYNDELCLHRPDTNQFHQWVIRQVDIDGTDWVII